MSAGARFAVIRCCGYRKPEFVSAERTRSLDSRTAASGRPTMVNEGRPEPMSTSTCTGSAFTPIRAKVRAIANMGRSYEAGPRDWCAQRLDAVTNSLRFARGPGAEIAQPRGMTYARQ